MSARELLACQWINKDAPVVSIKVNRDPQAWCIIRPGNRSCKTNGGLRICKTATAYCSSDYCFYHSVSRKPIN
jgi:hypothetical protein